MYSKLRSAIADFYGIDSEYVLPLNGAAEALYLLLLALKPCSVIVLEPTFGDHAATLTSLNVLYIALQYIERPYMWVAPLDLALEVASRVCKPALIWFSNPNNPTGCVIERRRVDELLEHVPEDVVLVVDEAFIEISPSYTESLLGIEIENLIVVRSLTKTLAVPGLRIGFAYIPNKKLMSIVDAARQPWNVNSIASHAITRVLREYGEEIRRFIDESRKRIEVELNFLSYELSKLRVTVYRSSAPFILIRHDPVPNPSFRHRLLSKGVAVRDASSFKFLTPLHSRVSVRKREENRVLIEKLREVLGIERG